MRTTLVVLWLGFLGGWLLLGSVRAEQTSGDLSFHPAGDQEFSFDTGVLKGKLRAGGRSKGLSAVVHVPSGMRLDDSMGLMGHYRVFTKAQRYGTAAWDWSSRASLQGDGSVTVRWVETPERPFELSASYAWASPVALDVVTTVKAGTNLVQFECFLASYFAEPFTNSAAYVHRMNGSMLPVLQVADAKYGTWQAFPRDDTAAGIILDGRWKVPPSPVEWVIMPRLQEPMGIRRCLANGLTAIMSARSSACFAVLTPEQNEGHRSLYLSLFGRDIAKGEIVQATTRFVVAVTDTDEKAINAYKLNSLSGAE